MEMTGHVATGTSSAGSAEHTPRPAASIDPVDTAAAFAAAPPGPRAERAGHAALPLAIRFSPSGVPIDALRAEGFDGSA